MLLGYLNPGESTDYQNRGTKLLYQAGATQRNPDYTEAINLNPNAPFSYYQRGVLIADKGKAHEAFPDLEKALQIAQRIGDEEYIADIQQAPTLNITQFQRRTFRAVNVDISH